MDPERLFYPEVPADAPPRRARVRMLLIGAVSFLGVTVATYFAIAAADLDLPYVEVFSDKMEHLQTNGDDYDVMFLGTSSVYRNVNPREIDRNLAERGVHVRSVNLAIPGMNVVEADNLFAEIERLRPKRLRMIVLEPVLRPLDPENAITERAIMLHDWPRTKLALEYVLAPNAEDLDSTVDTINQARAHLMSYAGRLASLGRIATLIFPNTKEIRKMGFSPPDFERGGFFPLDEEPGDGFRKRYAYFQRRRAALQAAMATPKIQSARADTLSERRALYMQDLVERVRALEAEPVFLIGPTFLYDKEMAAFLARCDELFADVPLLNYVKGYGYRDIYDLDCWFDEMHLNSRGVARLAERIAADLAPLLQTPETAGVVQADTRD